MILTYTGVGSRETPEHIQEIITKIAIQLDNLGYTLRSGGADGADTAFSKGSSNKEIYIPWKGFAEGKVPDYSSFADDLLKEVHPAYEKLSQGAKKLHLRNVNQVLGDNLNKPSNFLICWAKTDKNGIPKGGTRTAWMIAKKFGVPCFNLYIEKDFDRVTKLLKK